MATQRLSDERLAEVERTAIALREIGFNSIADIVDDLLAEVERLRGELAARPNAQPMNAVIKNQPTAEEWGTKSVGKQGVVWGQCVICGEDLDQQGGANGYNYCFLCSTGQQPHQRVKQ